MRPPFCARLVRIMPLMSWNVSSVPVFVLPLYPVAKLVVCVSELIRPCPSNRFLYTPLKFSGRLNRSYTPPSLFASPAIGALSGALPRRLLDPGVRVLPDLAGDAPPMAGDIPCAPPGCSDRYVVRICSCVLAISFWCCW